MAMVTITANNTLGDASFSSYLNGAEGTFVLERTKSRQNSFSVSHNGPIPLGRNKSENGEIDVFSAERYFNEPLEEQEVTPNIMSKKDDPDGVESLKRYVQPATPSVRSESSWNSRSLLLKVPTPQKPPKRNSSWRKSFLASLGCNCSCNDDYPIDVSNHSNQGEARKGDNNRHMNKFGRTTSNICLNENKREFARRKSVDVFKTSLQIKGGKPSSLDREVKMLAWDAIPPKGLEIKTLKCPKGEHNETNSESSSDLFEIESFSTNCTNPYLARQESDVKSGCITPTSCYAPSEASIQWSTVTASMADFSVMSDFEDLETAPARSSRSRSVWGDRNRQTSKQMTNKSPSILSSCKTHKAVRVAGEAHRTANKAYSDSLRQQRMQTINPTRIFQT
ncbi:hypothetical protein Leryth_024394 [Lithospermum erythrorhizon]|nr:hypothetical protein Leryth_024394 [Lithospermum erythrorhizon]